MGNTNRSGRFHQETLDDLLITAAGYGDPEALKFLHRWGANIQARDGLALQTAAACGYAECVEYLLDSGADAQAGNNKALRAAADQGHDDIVILIARRAAKSKATATPPTPCP